MSWAVLGIPGRPDPFVPFEHQREFLEYMDTHSPENPAYAMAVWPRRTGKDLTSLHQLLVKAHEQVGVYWHGLPTYEQARKSCWTAFRNDLGQRLMDNVFPREIVRRPSEWAPNAEMLVELNNGSLVQFVGSDSIDSIVGAGPRGVNCSEFSLWKPNAFDFIRPMLRESRGWAAFLMTPRGHNHAWRQYQLMRGDPRTYVGHRDIFTVGMYTREQAQTILDDELRRGMLPEHVRQEYMTDFAAAMVGSYWGDALEALEKGGALEAFEHPRDQVFVVWDLGFDDAFAMWAYRVTPTGADFIAHYENHSQPLSHYVNVLDEWRRPPPAGLGLSYRGAKLWLPHDAKAHTLITGETVAEKTVQLARERDFGCLVDLVPNIGRLDGIEAARGLLLTDVRFHPRCNERNGRFGREGVEALRQYHRNYDEARRVFMNEPEHDWSSHSADAFRYAAVSMRLSRAHAAPSPTSGRPTSPPRQVYVGVAPGLDEKPRHRRERA